MLTKEQSSELKILIMVMQRAATDMTNDYITMYPKWLKASEAVGAYIDNITEA